jgi:peptide-methionine (S)-S-oxide reductase
MTEKATFAAGCFWKPEAEFKEVPGVVSTQVGYTGGTKDDPTYEEVCSGTTGHAEAVQIEFDPEKVSYQELLARFWAMHDPTTANRQGPDVGTQYRSAIFTHSDEQAKAAAASKASVQERVSKPIVTQVESAADFWRAEEYHQCYLEKQRPGVLARFGLR